jgi:hypothetical protein
VRSTTLLALRFLASARARVAARFALMLLVSTRARVVTVAGAEMRLAEGRGFLLSWVGPGISLPDSSERLERVLVGMFWCHRGLRWMSIVRHWNWQSAAHLVHVVRTSVLGLLLLRAWLLILLLLLLLLVLRLMEGILSLPKGVLLLLEGILLLLEGTLLLLLEGVLLLLERILLLLEGIMMLLEGILLLLERVWSLPLLAVMFLSC